MYSRPPSGDAVTRTGVGLARPPSRSNPSLPSESASSPPLRQAREAGCGGSGGMAVAARRPPPPPAEQPAAPCRPLERPAGGRGPIPQIPCGARLPHAGAGTRRAGGPWRASARLAAPHLRGKIENVCEGSFWCPPATSTETPCQYSPHQMPKHWESKLIVPT
jgi:hypothetical protein